MRGVTPLPTDSTTAALAAVRSDDADYACVPIENSIEGSVLPTLDSLATGPELQIFAELTLEVAFTIVVRPGTSAADVQTVAAFPVAGAQVRRWLAENLPTAQVVPANSNAAAADDVAANRADAGVSTALAAERYGLATLASDVVDEPNARTRFVFVGPPGPPPPNTGADRTSVVLRLDNVPGALVSAMTEFGDPRHRSDPHRIPAHPKGVGHLHLLPRLRRAYRRRRRRRGTHGASSSLCRCAISGFMADGIGGGRGAARNWTRRRGGWLGCEKESDERAAGTDPPRSVSRQRRTAARHPSAGRGSHRPWPRAGAHLRPRLAARDSDGRALGRDARRADGRRDRCRTRSGAA